MSNKTIAYVEDEIAGWLETDDLARDGLVALRNGDAIGAAINITDIRSLAARRLVASGKARKGEYDE